jgi:hypothetical protein
MRRVFAVDVLECPRCEGRMKILAAIHPPDTTRAILECVGLPACPPPIRPARADPDEEERLPGWGGGSGPLDDEPA